MDPEIKRRKNQSLMRWNMSKGNISLKNVKHSNDGGNTKVKISKKQQIKIKYDTAQLEEGFYTTFLGINAPGKITSYNALQMKVATENEVSMNLDLILSKNANVKLKEDSYVVFQPDDSPKTRILSIEDGTFCLPAKVTGTVTMPLRNLEQHRDTTFDTVGFIIVLPENSSTGLTISELQFVKDTTIAKSMGTYCIMKGEERPEIPTQGEYVYNYALLTENSEKRDIQYSLITPQPGVSMSEDGILKVTSEAESMKLGIQAKIDSNVLFHTIVDLVHPWYVDQNMTQYYLPTESEVSKYSQKEESIFYQYSISVCAAIVVVFLGFLAFYHATIKTKKKNKQG